MWGWEKPEHVQLRSVLKLGEELHGQGSRKINCELKSKREGWSRALGGTPWKTLVTMVGATSILGTELAFHRLQAGDRRQKV